MRGLSKLVSPTSEKQNSVSESPKTEEEKKEEEEKKAAERKARGNNGAKRNMHFEMETVERIVAYFNENGFNLDKQTAHGLIKKTADLFENLYGAMRKAVKEAEKHTFGLL